MNAHRLASWLSRSIAALVMAGLAACGGSDEDPPSAGTSATIGAAGGTLDGPAGSQLVVPAGALAQATVLTIAQGSDGAPALPAGAVDIGAAFALTPHGTSFAVPATIRVPFDAARLGAGELPTLWKTNAAQTGWEQVPGAVVSGSAMEAEITTFSWTIIRTPTFPPLIGVAPAPQAVTEPAPATFSVGATSLVSSGPLAYQWRRNGAVIVGANAATYTTGTTSVAADNGALYSVDVSNSVGTTQSGSATLTVTIAPVTTASLAVTVMPANGGSVTSVPAGISCGADCSETYPLNTAVALTATPAAGFTFSAWGPTCPGGAVTMTAGVACTATFVAAPAPASGLDRIAAGGDYSLAVNAAGTAYSWGSDGSAQLGNGTQNSNRPTPEAIVFPTGVKSVSAGEGHGIAVLTDGSAWAWGYGGYIDCGAGVVQQSPVQIAASGVVAASAGASHSLLLRTDGTVLSIGCNFEGELGRAGTVPPQSPAAVVPGLPTIVAVAAGSGYSLALDSAGFVWAWGKAGVRADGSAPGGAPRATPMQVQGLNQVTAISAGSDHALALHGMGVLVAWGRNDSGELGDGTTTARGFLTATLLTPGVTAIAAGEGGSLAVRNGEVLSWGRNFYGQLGTGSTTPFTRSTPEVVVGVTGAVAVSLGKERVHALVLRVDGSVWSWGNNAAGQLGDGSTLDRFTPVPVPGLDLH